MIIGLALGFQPERAEAVSLTPPNGRPVPVLGQLDIDADGFADAAADSDGDGLPDNFETGGAEPFAGRDRVVSFPAPAAVRSAEVPSFLLSRPAVTTKADQYDSDGDNLSDFIEVFGLKFIDDNGNSRLDFEPNIDFRDGNGNGKWDIGESIFASAEWLDLNMDGMPSISEWPLVNAFGVVEDLVDANDNAYVYVLDDCDGNTVPETVRIIWNVPAGQRLAGAIAGCSGAAAQWPEGIADDDEDGIPDRVIVDEVSYGISRRASDFDGFVFTDPTVWDTDADGSPDGEDRDPLVNAATVAPAFGSGFERALAPSPDDQDLDNDGLGDGSDFGNDLIPIVDFPSDLAARLAANAPPDRQSGCDTPTVPEALIEDLLEDDWNGDGLWRLSDASQYRLGIPLVAAGQNCIQQVYGAEHDELFVVGAHRLYGESPLLGVGDGCRTPANFEPKACVIADEYNARGTGLGWQERLLQSARARTTFFPDPRLWAVLYAWRTPGFDIDGNGRTGVFDNTFSTDDVHNFVMDQDDDSPFGCGACGAGPLSIFAMAVGFSLLKLVAPRRR
jgi:hypothetical protein